MRAPSGARRAVPLLVVAAALLVALEAEAAIRWTSNGRLSATVQPVDVRFEVGEGGANPRHFHQTSTSANATSFSTTVKAKAGADLRVQDVVRLVHHGDEPQRVTLHADHVENEHFEALAWTVRQNGTVLATLDHRSQWPAASITVQPGARYEFDLRVDLADGAGTHNAGVPLGLWMGVAK